MATDSSNLWKRLMALHCPTIHYSTKLSTRSSQSAVMALYNQKATSKETAPKAIARAPFTDFRVHRLALAFSYPSYPTSRGQLKEAYTGKSGAGENTYPLKIEQVLLEGLPGLGLLTLIDNVRILLIPTALIILAAMSLPIS